MMTWDKPVVDHRLRKDFREGYFPFRASINKSKLLLAQLISSAIIPLCGRRFHFLETVAGK